MLEYGHTVVLLWGKSQAGENKGGWGVHYEDVDDAYGVMMSGGGGAGVL